MPRVRLPSGELRDEIREPLFDSFDLAAATDPTGTNSFFTAVQGRPRSETNLRQNNILEATVSFRVQGLGFDAQNLYFANRGALPLIMENSSLTFRVGEKIYWEANTLYQAGRVSDSGASGATDASFQHYGFPAVQSVMFDAKHVIDIPPLQNFQTDWTVEGLTAAEIVLATPAANTKIRFFHSLKGLKRRPVQ